MSSKMKTEKICIVTSKKIVKFLENLVDTGFYGKTREEAAEQLMRRALEGMITSEKYEKLKYIEKS